MGEGLPGTNAELRDEATDQVIEGGNEKGVMYVRGLTV